MKKINFTNQSTREVFAEKDFDSFNKLMFQAATNTLEDGVSMKEANDKIREISYAVLGLDENATRKQVRNAIRRHKIDIYEVTEELIQDLLKTGWGDDPFFREFVEIKNLDDGDTNIFYTPDDVILTVAEISGNHHDLFRQRLGAGKSFPVKTSWYGVKIYTEYEQFLTGAVDWAAFVQKVYEAFDKKVNDMIYSSLTSVATQLTPAGQFYKTGNLDRDTLLTLIEDVQGATGDDVVIMGTKSALGKLDAVGDASWRSNEMKQERYTTGRLGYWEGIRKIEIPQSFAPGGTTQKQVDPTLLLFMPVSADNKFIKLFNEGEARIHEDDNPDINMDMTLEFEYQQKLGVATVLGKKFGVWDIVTTD